MNSTAASEFDSFAQEYDSLLISALSLTGELPAYYARQRVQILKRLFLKLKLPSPSLILDFGCGTGNSYPYLRELWPSARIIGTDASQESLEIAKTRAGFEAVPLETAARIANFDLVFTNGVFHHIAPEDREGWIGWIRKVMAPEGHFAFFENNPWNPGTKYVMSRCAFDCNAVCLSPSESRDRLRRAGFELVALRSLFYFPRQARILRALESLLSWLPFGGQYLCFCRKG